VEGSGDVLLLTVNAREIRRVVRSERLALAIIFAVTLALSMLLSRFLARPSRGRCGGWRWPRTGSGSGVRARWTCRACLAGATRSGCWRARFTT
jgi:hypothetical protein